ncbi:RidA family protein [Chloroflexota bacterium]
MPREAFLPDARKQPISGVVRAGDFVIVAGQVGTRDIYSVDDVIEGIEPQIRQAVENMKKCLETAGATLDDVVRGGIFLKNHGDWAIFKKVWQEYFPKDFPALTTIVVDFVNPKLLLEIECLAYAPRSR